jgi:hypothetical protein
VLCIAGLLVGCARSKDTGDQTAPPTHKRLTKVVLRSTDLPRGWKGTRTVHDAPKQSAEEQAAIEKSLATCLKVPPSITNKRGADSSDTVAEAESADFELGDAVISSSATSYRTHRAINEGVLMLRNPKVRKCAEKMFASTFKSVLASTATVTSVTVTITLKSAADPDALVARCVGKLTLRGPTGKRATLYLNIAFIAGTLVEVDLYAFSVNRKFPDAVMRRAVEAVANRVAAT